ncbi:MAG: ATP-dependent helicase [archaeon]|nr:ATP-dependent helicase [archaeon]
MNRATRMYSKDEIMGLMEPLISTWFNEKFSTLSEPQARAVPIIHERRNVLVSSPTGSGKTLTAFMSIINELVRYASEGKLEERVYCIYVSPLKALANDISKNLSTPLAEMKEVAERRGVRFPDIRVAVRSGDTSQYERQKMVRHPPHIFITTPESLALVLESPKFRTSFRNIEWLILDEIHDVCSSKRGAFLSLTIERLQQFCSDKFTRIGLSATMAPIEAISGYLVGADESGIRDVTIIESSSKKVLDLKVVCPAEDITTLSSDVASSMMYDVLKNLIETHDTTLVFTNTRSGAESVVYKLKERGLDNIEVHHSSLSRETRLDVEEKLKCGKVKCVVSSTSLELGIDIGSVDLVCQIGSPKSVAKGLQRIGRSGHSMGRIAKGRILIFDPDDLVECAVMCRAAHNNNIDRVDIPENCLDVLSQAIVGMSLSTRWNIDDAFKLVRGSYCYRNLSKMKFLNVLRYLGSKDEYEGVYSKIWFDEEEGVFGRKKGSKMIYFMNIGTIPEEANYRVMSNHGSAVGELSEKFVERLSPRDIFVLGGRSFEYIRLKGMTAYVKEATGKKPTVPSWAGEMLPRSFDLSMNVAVFRGEIANSLDRNENDLVLRLSECFDIDNGCARSIVSYFREQKMVSGSIPDNKDLFIEEYIDPSGNQKLIFHFPFGRRVNDALSRGYAYEISNTIGVNASVTISDDNFMIGTSRKVNIEKIPTLLTSKNIEVILRKAVKNSEIFKLRFRHTAVRSFMILKNYMGRSISVNRQQIRSSYLLNALGDMDNMPVVEETYREILEDDMDVKNAQLILENIESKKMVLKTLPYTGVPSPFAHGIILSGFSDIILMEDRSALLRELHRKVLYRAMGSHIKEFEFEENQVIPYFVEKIGRISKKDDVLRILERTGPLRVIKEQGRNVYAYSDVDKRTVDTWVRELIEENFVGTVFLDDPYILPSSEIPFYASATRRIRDLTDDDKKILECFKKDSLTLSDISEKLKMDENLVFRCIRKLESMYLITRCNISGKNKWSFCKYEGRFEDEKVSYDHIIMGFLNCYAPATIQEVAYSLSIPESAARRSLESLVAEEKVVCGRFLISENDQYMKKLDHMRLRAKKSNIFDYDTVEKYRFYKCPKFKSIMDFFDYYGCAGSEIDVFNKVENFDLKEWYRLRSEEKILLGRFLRGKVRFVTSEFGEKLASLRSNICLPEDEVVLEAIGNLGSATMRQIVNKTGIEKERVKESILRLDKSLVIIRAFDEREDWGTENVYKLYRPSAIKENLVSDIVRQMVNAYGPIPVADLGYILEMSPENTAEIAEQQGIKTILVGDGQTPMLIMADEIQNIDKYAYKKDVIHVCSLFDPYLSSKWAEILSRYGDKWIYPLVSNGIVVGALEAWEMSGCIEIRSVDVDDIAMLPDVLVAIDEFMKFFKMKGVDIVRIREILTVDPIDFDNFTIDVLTRSGYKFINGFYAKGDFLPKSFSERHILSYVFKKQHVCPASRYSTVTDVIQTRGYVRTDAELFTRVKEKTTIRKQMEYNDIIRADLMPSYVGYTTKEMAAMYRAARNEIISDDMKVILKVVQDHQPVSKRDIIRNSTIPEDSTVNAINSLFHADIIYTNFSGHYCVLDDFECDRNKAVREIVKKHFEDFGIFPADVISTFCGQKMSIMRQILAELEADGILVKGFFLENDPTLMWMLSSDVDKLGQVSREDTFILNSQDNLSVYLRSFFKREIEGSDCVIFRGTDIIGSFKGKVTNSGVKVKEFKGSSEAKRYLRHVSMALGVSLDDNHVVQKDRDWDISEFYIKTNPGAF